jgi:hypothetical protein
MSCRFCIGRRVVLLAILIMGGTASPVQAAGPFDGRWSVIVTTEAGSCSRSFTALLSLSEGRVTYVGSDPITASGRISDSGKVSVRFTHEGDVVNGNGTLRKATGTGGWNSPTRRCSGSWFARKQ